MQNYSLVTRTAFTWPILGALLPAHLSQLGQHHLGDGGHDRHDQHHPEIDHHHQGQHDHQLHINIISRNLANITLEMVVMIVVISINHFMISITLRSTIIIVFSTIIIASTTLHDHHITLAPSALYHSFVT